MFKILSVFNFLSFLKKNIRVLHDSVGLCLEKLSVAWVVFNIFIPIDKETFGLRKVTFFSCLVEGMSQTSSFQGLFLTVLFLLNKSDSGLFETVTYKPKGKFLKTVAALSVHLFMVDSAFFHPGEITFL